MGLQFRKRIKLGKHLTLNISNHGVSVTKKIGKLTFGADGKKSIRLGKGFSYKFKK